MTLLFKQMNNRIKTFALFNLYSLVLDFYLFFRINVYLIMLSYELHVLHNLQKIPGIEKYFHFLKYN